MVRCGIDLICDGAYSSLLKNKKIGLVSGASAVSSRYLSTIEHMNELYNVSMLLAPEHGIRGVLGPGEKVSDGVDILSGIKTYSLFEDFVFSCDDEKKKSVYAPSPRLLEQIDILVFDMQDVGSRFFTFASTLFYTMRACASVNIPVLVLDRPNPIGGAVEGNICTNEFSSFIGLSGLPIRHGMTIGELAILFNGEYGFDCDLTVAELDGWRRDMFYNDTGLPFVKPSPNLPSLDAITVYCGTCMLAGTNVSEGRGTTTPFTTIGAPYINPVELAKELNRENFEGLSFSPSFFMPQFSKYKSKVCYGVDIHVLDRKSVRAVDLGVRLIKKLQRMYPDDFAFNRPESGNRWHIDLSAGGHEIREGKLNENEILKNWQTQACEFEKTREKYLIYR